MKIIQVINFYAIAVFSTDIKDHFSPGHLYYHMSVPSDLHFMKKRNFIPSPITFESMKPWSEFSGLLDGWNFHKACEQN